MALCALQHGGVECIVSCGTVMRRRVDRNRTFVMHRHRTSANRETDGLVLLTILGQCLMGRRELLFA